MSVISEMKFFRGQINGRKEEAKKIRDLLKEEKCEKKATALKGQISRLSDEIDSLSGDLAYAERRGAEEFAELFQ